MEYTISLSVVDDIKITGKKVGDYVYNEDDDSLSFSLPYPFPCKFTVKSLKVIEATPMMMRLWTCLKYHNMDWLRQQLLQIQCVNNNSVLLHGSAWSRGGVGHLAVGFPNCGKTSMVLREMTKNDPQEYTPLYCSDENVIVTKDLDVYPVERKTSLNPWISKEIDYPLTLSQRIEFFKAGIISKVMPIFEPNIWVDLPYKRHSFKLHKIIYLTEGKNKNLSLLTDNEFPFYTNPVIQTYAYASGFDLDKIYRKYRRILETISANT